MPDLQQILFLLGGAQLLGVAGGAPADLRHAVREGLPYASVQALAGQLDLEEPALTRLLCMSERTRARRKGGQLTETESDRLVRLARVAAHALAVFEDRGRVNTWLERPNTALSGERPLALLDTDLGASQVDLLLTRIELGVYS